MAAVLLLPGTASGATTIGSTFSGAQPFFPPPTTYVQRSTDATSPSYTVPAGGTVITSFSVRADADSTDQVKFKVFRPTGTPDRYTVIGSSATQTLVANTLNTFTVAIPVQAGDVIGLASIAGTVPVARYGFAAGDEGNQASGDFAVGSAYNPISPSGSTLRLNVSATVDSVAPPPPPPPPPGGGAGQGAIAGNGGNGGNGGKIVGGGGGGGNAGPCGGGGAGGGGLASAGGGAGGGGCFGVDRVQSLSRGKVSAVAGVAKDRTTVRADVFADMGPATTARTSRARAPHMRLIGSTLMGGLHVGRYTVVVHLTKKASRALSMRRKVTVSVRLKMTAPTGAPFILTRSVTLKR